MGKQLGIPYQQFQKHEKGTSRIPAGRLFRIATILGTDVQSLYSGDFLETHSSQHHCDETLIEVLKLYQRISNSDIKLIFREIVILLSSNIDTGD